MPKKKQIKVKEPKDGIYVLDKRKEMPKKQHKMKMIYTLIGEQSRMFDGNPILTTDEKDIKAYAYCELIDNITKFYIRRSESGGLYNPCSLDMRETHKVKLLKDQGNKYVEVTEDCFKQYLEFLKSKKITHFRFAERARQ